jgi:nucleotide-binding universal stress UspA family protein
MKDDNLITLAIHTVEKALILKQTLKEKGIDVSLVNVAEKEGDTSKGLAVRVKRSELMRAVSIIENMGLFRYDDERIHKIDDGRKRILVAVDFSDYSIKSCQAAFAVASQMNAKVKILHVYRVHFPITFPFAEDDKDKDVLAVARKRMLDFCYEIDKKITDKEFPPVNYSYSLREGIASEEVENFVKEYRPTLLVLGRKGVSNNESAIMGNMAADIIEMTNVPVMVIPKNFKFKDASDIKHIAFLTNFQKSDLNSFDLLVDVLRPYPTVKITLLHINVISKEGEKWKESELESMQKHFNERYPELNVGYKLIDSPNMLDAIEHFIEKENVSIISMNTRRRNLFGRIFLPSISRKMLNRSDITLVIFRG